MKGSRHSLSCAVTFLALTGSVLAQSPFAVSPSVVDKDGVRSLQIAFTVPTNHFLYADRLSFETMGRTLDGVVLPEPVLMKDKFSDELKKVFSRSFGAACPLPGGLSSNLVFAIHFQGCDEANCFFPEEKVFTIGPDGSVTEAESGTVAAAALAGGEWRSLAGDFEIVARGSGYLNEGKFLAFLDRAEAGASGSPRDDNISGWGILATLCLMVLGGVGLNLTPCILPMIPINLAIIGAGAQAGSQRRGFLLGGTYAAGMAVAYGTLGLVVVLTGSKFGTLNSSPWFNLGIAAVFLVLALSMFDIFAIDFSRFQPRSGASGRPQGKFVLAYSMGTIAALLAGACVAPVVISVLLQATTLYNKGIVAGLFLPFLLGIGMGLPWPFAGAGLSFLPKPGRWMPRVKYAFGTLITLFVAYYGHLAFSLFKDSATAIEVAVKSGSAPASSASQNELINAMKRARSEGKPVFVDFWASWCKNCSAMEHTTFNALAVRRRLGLYVQVRYQAEHPNRAGTKDVLDYFGAMGLPTYVVLQPKSVAMRDKGEGTVATAMPILSVSNQSH